MNRNYYRLVFNTTLGMMVPVAETARRAGKAGSGTAASGAALALAGAMLAGAVHAELPVASANFAAPGTTARYMTSGQQAWVNQVGNKAIMNFDRFNVSAGHDVKFQQVDSLATQNLVQGANFTALARIHDSNPSIIAGSISQGAGQRANITLINSNGIAFVGGSQVNVNSFTASTLNMADTFVLDGLLQPGKAQFEGTGGFIKVFEGAKITAGSSGRVMLIAPTVVNKGTLEAPDGQIILAAANKVYLRASEDKNVRGLLVEVDSAVGLASFDAPNAGVKDGTLDGQTVSLANAAEDKLGHATNQGTLATPRGNITMVGYAVNQSGIARATSSVVSNGSVYLLAKDTTAEFNKNDSLRGGRVTLGTGSVTEVLPEKDDRTAKQDDLDANKKFITGMTQPSRVLALGQEVEMQRAAQIIAASGQVDLIALDNPSQYNTVDDPLLLAGALPSAAARIHVAEGARISVAGLENVEVSAARNSVEVELRGDELKDSPINREGPLRGEKVYVDLNRALANADGGKNTLIARDSLESYRARLDRTAAERSTAGGTVNIHSQGAAILDSGAVVDLSGGSVKYTAANVKTTLLNSGGKSVDLADADADARYDGISTRFVKDFGRWNVKQVFDLGQSYRYDPGYVEGKDAGVLSVFGMSATAMGAEVQGRTTTGTLQREAGIQPLGAKLTVGSDKAGDYKLNQRVVFSQAAALQADDFINTLVFDPALLGKDRVTRLEVFSNQAAEVREALRAPQAGSVSIIAREVAIDADVSAQGGTLVFQAKDNSISPAIVPPAVTVDDGVTLSARGDWVNNLPTAPKYLETAQVHGGSVTLAAVGDVTLGSGTLIDVDGGGRIKPDGKLVNGNGGKVSLTAGRTLKLGGDVRGYALGKGGTYSLKTGDAIRIVAAGTSAALESVPGVMTLDAAFFQRGGFATFDQANSSSIEIADAVHVRPLVQSLELLQGYTLQPSGQTVAGFTRVVTREDAVRQTANLSLKSTSNDLTQGSIRLGAGAEIAADDRATVTLNASKRLDILGSVRTAGGSISATLSRSESDSDPFDPASAIVVGAQAVLDTAGAARTVVDSKGLTQGEVLAGGNVTLNAETGYVVTAAGSRIDVSGAAPVRLDVRNEAGGLGRQVGSDAGTVTIAGREGVLLDGAIAARGGDSSNRGGTFNLALLDATSSTRSSAAPDNERVLTLAQTAAPQAEGLQLDDAIPDVQNGNSRIGTQALEAAGFERMNFASRDVIRFADGLAIGAGRTAPLREVSFAAPRIETGGGNAGVAAHTVRFANSNPASPVAPVAGTGTLTASAALLEVAGDVSFSGMEKVVLQGEQMVRLAGSGAGAPEGAVRAAADLVFHGAVIAPATAAVFKILSAGHRVDFTRNTNAPEQPWSALGSLSVEASEIVQDGNIWAPHGQLDFQASDTLLFKNGSLTSVAATPGSLLPYGQLVTGREWRYGTDKQDDLRPKSIRTAGASVDMQVGARIDLSGGGDLQAYEFTVGPGGSRDILADKNTYAILPGKQPGFAPGDTQEGFDRASGEAVYLSGVAGLLDGVYTLLPAHYALLPGAYAVKLDSGIQGVLPGQAYSRQDGVRVAAGYVTDSRTGAPKDANWQGVQVLTHDQVRARSEFTLTRASDFFADSRNRPQDAGLLSIKTTGSGIDALKLDATYNMQAGVGGRGAQVDISALKLAVTSGAPAGIDPDTVALDASKLNALGADSLFIGGTRSSQGDTTTPSVDASAVTLANDAANTLKASEVMLASTDTLTLKAGSVLDAQGAGGDAGHYTTVGNGALVRAASTTATFSRSGSPDGSVGTLAGEAGSRILAADSITLDATQNNAYKGTTRFEQPITVNGVVQRTPVDGNLAVGATRINFGTAPEAAEGITYSQADLDAFNSLKGLTLTSYSTFDFYTGKTDTVNGLATTQGVKVGGLDGNKKPTLQNLTLQGAGLAGIDTTVAAAQLNAKNLTLSNPAAATFALPKDANGNELALGSGQLAVTADTLTLGQGGKAIKGFDAVTVTANELVAATGTGKLDVNAPLTLNVARISGERGADQALNSTGALTVAQHTADRTLAPVTALGAKWAMTGSAVDFNSHAELPSGTFTLTATAPKTVTTPAGNVTLGADARVDVGGRAVQFFDVSKPSWGGTAEFVSEHGDVTFVGGAKVDVSAAAGGDAGTLIVRAAKGAVSLADGSVSGSAEADADKQRGEGARAVIDTGTLDSFSVLNTALNSGGFDGERDLRVRKGNVSIASTDVVKAQGIKISVDGAKPDEVVNSVVVVDGKLDVVGTLDASGVEKGRIELFAKNDVDVQATAQLKATSSGANEDGGDIVIGTRDGEINLAASDPGKGIDVSGGAGGQGGTLLLRAPRIDVVTNGVVVPEGGVAVTALDSSISGARTVSIEAVKVYDNKTTLTTTGASSGTTLSLATLKTDNDTFAGKHAAIKTKLGKTETDSTKPGFVHIVSGVEVRSSGDMTLGADWNLKSLRANGEAGVLTLAADGNLNINSNLSDGFDVATPLSGTAPATLLDGDSWSYRLLAGADREAADPLAVKPGSKSLTLAASKLIRTGTGDIRIASGGDIKFADNKAAIYTAGRLAKAGDGFITPKGHSGAVNFAQFSQGGGDVTLRALGDVLGKASTQLYSNWLFRQGRTNADATAYEAGLQPAWWVRFDQFQQGVGALGGGDVSIAALGKVENLSASAPTQAHMTATTPDGILTETGGGDVRVQAAGDVLGGQYYAGRGQVAVTAGGTVGSAASNKALYTIIALGDAQAKVRADGDANVHAAINPHLIRQTIGTTAAFNVTSASTDKKWSLFSTYGENSSLEAVSLAGKTKLHNGSFSAYGTLGGGGASTSGSNYNQNMFQRLLPSSVGLAALQGDAEIAGTAATLNAAPNGDLTVLAAGSVDLPLSLRMSDADQRYFPDATHPVYLTNRLSDGTQISSSASLFDVERTAQHAQVPVHQGDDTPVRIYAVAGDVTGKAGLTNLTLPKAVQIRAGNDIRNLGVVAQHVNTEDVSRITAGRDLVFDAQESRSASKIWIGGPGRLEVTAGRHLDLGASEGIVSRGDLDNPALAAGGLDIHLAAGVGANGIDYLGAVNRLLAGLAADASSEIVLWQARWLTGDNSLTASNALAAVTAVKALSPEVQREKVRTMLFTALRETGRDSNNPDSAFAGDYARGYAALETLFPGIGEKKSDGSARQYQGDINLFASRVKTERGGDIEFMLPGGQLVVGLANTSDTLTQVGNDVLGMVAAAEGDIRGFARDDILVNQSRILTVGGGDVLLWSSEADIDAGKGKKTATAVPPPIIKTDANGNVTQELQGAVTGSGIGALSTGGVTAGDVDLIAPKGTVNAGDAGIRAGNLNIAAAVVLGADNISVSGTSTGTPVADTSAVTAASSGATNADGGMSDATSALSNNLAEAARAAEELKQSFKPTFITAEVVGHGE